MCHRRTDGMVVPYMYVCILTPVTTSTNMLPSPVANLGRRSHVLAPSSRALLLAGRRLRSSECTCPRCLTVSGRHSTGATADIRASASAEELGQMETMRHEVQFGPTADVSPDPVYPPIAAPTTPSLPTMYSPPPKLPSGASWMVDAKELNKWLTVCWSKLPPLASGPLLTSHHSRTDARGEELDMDYSEPC